MDLPMQSTQGQIKQMDNNSNPAQKIEHAQFTVQDYPARLHTGHFAILQRVGYLARCCTQDVARHLARNIASCIQAFKVAENISIKLEGDPLTLSIARYAAEYI